MDKSSYDDIDSVKVRFFGWWPDRRAERVFLVFNIAYFLFCFFVWPFLPAFSIFGLFPAPWVWYLLITAVGTVAWTIYCEKYWYALEEENDEKK